MSVIDTRGLVMNLQVAGQPRQADLPIYPIAQTWRFLLPTDATYEGTLAAHGDDQLPRPEERGFAPRILLWSGESEKRLPRLDDYVGLVAHNPRRGMADLLRRSGFATVHQFGLAPSGRMPRWFIPLGNSATAAAAFMVQAPLHRRARLPYRAARLLARTGLEFWFRDRLLIALRVPSTMEQALREINPGTPVTMALSPGVLKPDVVRKPVIAGLSDAGEWLWLGKIGASVETRQALQHEGLNLTELARRFGAGWTGPRLLYANEIDGHFLQVQTPVLGSLTGARFTDAHARFLARLSGPERKRAIDTELVQSLMARAGAQPDLATPLRRVLPILEDLVIQQTVTHGDFHPGNLRRRGDEIVAFDWEFSRLDGLPLIDEFYFRLFHGAGSLRKPVDAFERSMRQFISTRPFRFGWEVMTALAVIFLLDATTWMEPDPGDAVVIREFIGLAHRMASSLDRGDVPGA